MNAKEIIKHLLTNNQKIKEGYENELYELKKLSATKKDKHHDDLYMVDIRIRSVENNVSKYTDVVNWLEKKLDMEK